MSCGYLDYKGTRLSFSSYSSLVVTWISLYCTHMLLCVRPCTDIKKQVLSMKGKPFQRPTRNGSLADRDITLHDPVMLDDEGLKKDMVKIFQKWEQAHG